MMLKMLLYDRDHTSLLYMQKCDSRSPEVYKGVFVCLLILQYLTFHRISYVTLTGNARDVLLLSAPLTSAVGEGPGISSHSEHCVLRAQARTAF